MMNCPKCNAEMEEGFTMDRGHYDSPSVETWVEGVPERSFWSGIKTEGKEQFAVTTYRCEGCGYLESYALLASDGE